MGCADGHPVPYIKQFWRSNCFSGRGQGEGYMIMLISPQSSNICGKLLIRSRLPAASSHPDWQTPPSSLEGEGRLGPRHPQTVTFWAPVYVHWRQRENKSNQICSSWADSKSNVPELIVSILTQPPDSTELRAREDMSSSLALVCMGQGSVRKGLFFFYFSYIKRYNWFL